MGTLACKGGAGIRRFGGTVVLPPPPEEELILELMHLLYVFRLLVSESLSSTVLIVGKHGVETLWYREMSSKCV